MNRLKSGFVGRDKELLPLMFAFYAPWAETVRDVTANKKRMWSGYPQTMGRPDPPFNVLFYDVDPQMDVDHVCSWDKLPDEDSSVDVLLFDPPHLPEHAASPKSDKAFAEKYGLSRGGNLDTVSHTYSPFLQEAARTLKPEGLIFAKIKDYVHNHKYQWMSRDFVSIVDGTNGLTPCDCIVKLDPSGGNMMSGRWKKAHHARNSHVFWFVVRKGGCESRR